MKKSQIKKHGRRPTPVTLYNQETGEKKTWKSMALAAKELGVTYMAIVQLVNGKQKTINGKWMLRSTYKPTVKKINETFKPINKELLEDWRALAPMIYALQKKGDNIGCQSFREIEDADIAESLGVQEINTSNHGADGRKDGEILFEHKNKSEDNLDVAFADLSLPRVEQFRNGILTANTIWKGFLQKKYTLVFNSKYVGDIILDGQKNYRKSATIPFNTVLKNGGKVIAWNGDLEGALEELQRLHPETRVTLADIYGPEHAKYVANLVMEVAE